MANDRIRSIDFLPEIFRTNPNRQFLASTLDQLVQEPKLKATQGYIGRRTGPGIVADDVYINESTAERNDYQLEPGIVFTEVNRSTAEDVLTYPGLIDALALQGSLVTKDDRLFASEHYSWDPFVDFDKFINFGQYYWLPEGPDNVDVASTAIPLTDNFDVTRGNTGYTFSDVEGTLPTITLVRQGNYTFDLNQQGNPFFIQAFPGADGTLPFNNQSSRDVLGVINNGEDVGTITFNVPAKDEQNFYLELESAGNVDLVTDLQFDQINNLYVDRFLAEQGGIDGISDLDGRTLIFLENDTGWDRTSSFDTAGTAYDTTSYDQALPILDTEKYSVWRISYLNDDDGNPYISLEVDREVATQRRVDILFGDSYASTKFWKTNENLWEKVPLITASADFLYYQDVNNPEFFGRIRLVDQSGNQALDIEEILTSAQYTSPNGVVFTNGLKVQFEGETFPSSYEGNEYYVEGVGERIQLLPVTDFITPEPYTASTTVPFDTLAFDEGGFDDTLNAPSNPDYFTINRASGDGNGWSRSNRWFHIDVINATAAYNKVTPVIDNNYRAQRPILEYKSGIKLFNFGTEYIGGVNVIDFSETDAFSNINGTLGYSVDGYPFIDGTKVIFANDLDPAVRNKIYIVNFAKFDDSSDPVIDLQPADITSPGVLNDQVVLVTNGITLQGNVYRFDGSNWISAQLKTKINQTPNFDIFDNNGYSFSNPNVYAGSSFAGTKLFSYATGASTIDSVLNLRLKYLSINNVGDIVFDNNFYTETFTYNQDEVSQVKNISDGFVKRYSDRTTYTNELGWQTSFTNTVSRQIFNFEYNNANLVLDVEVSADESTIPVKIFNDGVFVLPSTYTYSTNSDGVTEIEFSVAPNVGDLLEVSVVSSQASQAGYYGVPLNLENNTININTEEVTLGTVRNHYNTICQNLKDFTGKINGANNTRDQGNIVPYGSLILQQSSPLIYPATFLHNERNDFFKAIDYVNQEYQKYKNLILDTVATNDWSTYTTSGAILEKVFEIINSGKNENSPFYWTNMVPCGGSYEETSYTVSPITTDVFDTLYSYDFTQANYQGLLVYKNDTILLGDGHEYTVATDGPRITLNVPLTNGDVIRIREYTSIYGSYVPATPASLGISQTYEPEFYTDDTYINPTRVLQGHDGSKTVAFNDLRDDVLYEFEARIYSNIKVLNRYNPPLSVYSTVPGAFRTTDYSLSEINELLSPEFLTWAAQNNLDYKTQTYDANNAFTWNYSRSASKVDGKPLLGNWRGIYFNYYDTDSPHTRPWEMLGLTEKPDWWDDRYGEAPYTSGNLVLWEDMRDGVVADPTGFYVKDEFKRPEMLRIIPSDSEGNLLPPIDTVVGSYDRNSFRKNWVFGDQGPVETAWRRSSSYVYSLQKVMALSRPASFFSLNIDIDKYRYDTTLAQYLYNERYRIEPTTIEVYGNGTIKNSYINWIVDRNKILGINSTNEIVSRLNNLDVRLCYRLGAFSDKKYLKIFTEKSSPNSLNASLLLPDESFQLSLYKNPAFAQIRYSSVIVQVTATGYAVYGYSIRKPYFEILNSIPNGNFDTITVNGESARVALDFSNNVTRIPYGYEFTTKNGVVDFLISYGQLLEQQGMIFENQTNGVVLNWSQMAQEFLYWTQQGWAEGTIINLNPGADLFSVEKPGAVADNLFAGSADTVVLNQNKDPITSADLFIERIDNNFTVRSFENNTISYLETKFTAYEHIIVFDNTSIFNDLIFDPGTGARQFRLLIDGYYTYDWNGQLDAQGFILNQDNITEWSDKKAYTKGDIVLYKNEYWSAAEVVPPSAKFDFAKWIKSDFDQIQLGLLPNSATKADLMRNYYDTKTANLESDADLLAFGLIGFRPRQYMQNLNLNDISQVNLYSQFLGTKGTTQAVEYFSQANLNKEVADYDIFENWAIQRAVYGASDNRRYIELQLDQTLLNSNPSTVEVIEPETDSTANQTILVDNIWKSSYAVTDVNLFPTLDSTPPDRKLPTAGYVNIDDVDIQVFSLDDLTVINNNIDSINRGTSIWVAKSNRFDWNVYRANLVEAQIVKVTDRLDGTCTVTFDKNHNLLSEDKIIIKNFDDLVDGSYEVLTANSLKTLTIVLSLPGQTTIIEGEGTAFVLKSVRIAQPSDLINLPFVNNLEDGNQVWVDNDGDGKWQVLQKQDPFTAEFSLNGGDTYTNNLYGTSAAQGLSEQGALIGAPGYNNSQGAIYAYNKNSSNQYIETKIITLLTDGILGLGTSLASGNTQWAVAGAPDSASGQGYAVTINRSVQNGTFNAEQFLIENGTASDANFGYAVAISRDERWLYVGAPIEDTVYAYNQVTVQEQSLQFRGDGSTKTFNISDTIKVNTSDAAVGQTQLLVSVNGLPKTAGADFTFDGTSVTLVIIPNNGDDIIIRRKQGKTFLPSVSTTLFDISDLYTADSIYTFNVLHDGILQRPYLDYTYNTTTREITFLVGVTGSVVVDSATHYEFVDSFTYSGATGDSSTAPKFGWSLSTTTDGRQVIIGSPDDDPDAVDYAGSVQIMDRSVERFQVTDASVRTYPPTADIQRTFNGPVTVKLNSAFLQPTGFNNNGEFTVNNDNNQITIDSSINLAVGDIIEIESNTFKLMQSISSNNAQALGNFGYSVDQCSTNCSLYIGMPNDNTVLPESGSVDRWINQARLFGTITSTNANPHLLPGETLRINNYDVVIPGVTIAELVTYINDSNIPNVRAASTADGYITITLTDVSAADPFIKLQVLPGVGNAYDTLGFSPMVHAQTIRAPIAQEYSHFGEAVDINDIATTLTVGAPDGGPTVRTTFDTNTTLFDSDSTRLQDNLARSGTAYTFDYLRTVNASATNPGKFAFGQQLYASQQNAGERFGASMDYRNGILLVGTPKDDLGDSVGNYGEASQYNNIAQEPAWKILYSEIPIVDVSLLNSVFTYDKVSNSITKYLDYIDPLQGKILGAARQNINFIAGLDPAQYNTGSRNNNGNFWAERHLGEIWWDTSTVRFINYHQDDLAYRARRWGQVFPGSSIDVYQWIQSDVPPAEYSGEGSVYSTVSYTVGSVLNADGTFSSTYYYWVKGLTTISTTAQKTLSVQAIAQYIDNPRGSGISYIAAISPSTVALYNTGSLVSVKDTILHVEFDRTQNTDNVHVEFDLVAEGKPDSFLSDGLYRKMLDSFSGANTLGNPVPDVNLSVAEMYGVEFRPRQSFFADRFAALENYIGRANTILKLFPVAETKSFDLLNSEEAEPLSNSGEYDKKVATYAELTYQDLRLVPTGYRYLVSTDETNSGLWTIYTLQADDSLLLTRVQNYDTKQYWDYADWTLPSYTDTIQPTEEVAIYSDLLTLVVPNGTVVRVQSNSFGKAEVYQLVNDEWVRIFAENSTVQMSEALWNYDFGRFGFDFETFDSGRFDLNPIIETRQIIRAINEELFTDDLLIYRNQLLILVFEYIQTEQTAPDWLVKTSLIDVDHKIRDLLPFQTYRRDNQDFVTEYINEVKPYHVKIREFNLRYEGLDVFDGTLSDFDVPAYWNSTLQKFVSPVLDDTDYEFTTKFLESSVPSTDPIWQTLPWSQWYQNYKLSLDSVTITSEGTGYTVEPEVTITGNATRPAQLRARINTAGNVVEIIIDDEGEGYTETPVITITGGNGSGAKAVPIMGNDTTRSFTTTLKFDRYEYQSSVQDWTTFTYFEEGSLVRYLDKVYSVNNVDDSTALWSGAEFVPEFYTEVDASTLTGVDRIIGLYTPSVNRPARELALLISGIDYPGVQVTGPSFLDNTGYDVGGFDITPYDNLAFGPEGSPTYSDDILDAEWRSDFTDSYLGTLPAPAYDGDPEDTRAEGVVVAGGEFVDEYSSHAPEELVPGAMFDTLDIQVTAVPGNDWASNGHGFEINEKNVEYLGVDLTIDFSDLVEAPMALSVENETQGNNLNALENFTVNWPAKTVTITSGANVGDILGVRAFDVGGGNQIFKEQFIGDSVGNSLTIRIDYDRIYQMFIKVNGLPITNYTYAEEDDFNTTISFTDTYTSSDLVSVTVLGIETPQTTWSSPLGEYFLYDGSTVTFEIENSLQGTNPINLVVFRNGFRLRPPESVEYTADGSSAGPYYLPTTGGTNQGLIADNEVQVYVDNVKQNLAVDFTVSAWDGSSDRYVEFNTAPDVNSQIIVAITTDAAYTLSGQNLTLKQDPVPGSLITVVTYNDTSEQDILTRVFRGPTTEGEFVGDSFDSVDFDSATVDTTTGSFDYGVGVVVSTNNFDLGRTITDTNRIEVHKNGIRLIAGLDYTVSGTILTVGGSIISAADVITVTIFTMNVTPRTLEFAIFQDMRGNQKISRLLQNNQTRLAQALGASDDTIYVDDASKLSEAGLGRNPFAVVVIDGERIAYRTRNTTNNTLTGLIRGVAGTAQSSHSVDTVVYDYSLGNQLPAEYQQTTYSNTFTGDGVTTVFVATNVTLDDPIDSTEIEEAVRVKVGGTELTNAQYTVTQIDPYVEVTLVDAPPIDQEVVISIVKSQLMYAQGIGTASNGVTLQDQQTDAARFLRGEI